MEQRTYRGDIDPEGLADALMARFNHGDVKAQKVFGQGGHLMVQIATRGWGWGWGAKLGLAEKQLVVTCPYCGVGNPVGAGTCSACGGSLAEVQPVACQVWVCPVQGCPLLQPVRDEAGG